MCRTRRHTRRPRFVVKTLHKTWCPDFHCVLVKQRTASNGAEGMADSVFSDNEVIAGLDLGSTKVSVIVAEQNDDGVDIIGVGSVPCAGLKKGVVVNIDATVRAIKMALEQAETM